MDEIQTLAKAATDHGFLWKIQKQGHTGYLYGSIHLGKREWMVPGPTTIAALQSSKVIALELDILDPEIQAQLADPSQFGITRVPLPPPLQRRMDTLAAGIDKLVRTRGPVFAAVGSLHMVGAQSVPALLGKMGYTIERVMFDAF
ncbi:MAG: TraB/GumN family protein [Nitrospira sp.]|nr:TraB/GumN family protein [Nitrospira sp.]